MELKKYTLFWRTGKCEIIEGINFEDAFMRAGYVFNAKYALEFYANGDVRNDYTHYDGCGWVRKRDISGW